MKSFHLMPAELQTESNNSRTIAAIGVAVLQRSCSWCQEPVTKRNVCNRPANLSDAAGLLASGDTKIVFKTDEKGSALHKKCAFAVAIFQ